MAFDGITTAAIVSELNEKLCGGVINKIIQPEKDELQLAVRNAGSNHKLYISASASLPLIYLTNETRQAPLTAPAFTMLLRKHLQGGKIVSIVQPSLERIIIFTIEHLDELGDACVHNLIVELMGKYSNIILTDSDDIITDSIKRIPSSVSSVREVLPGHPYFIPDTQKKLDPFKIDKDIFDEFLAHTPTSVSKALFSNITGLCSQSAQEIAYEAGIDGGDTTAALTIAQTDRLYASYTNFIGRISKNDFKPCIIKHNDEPVEFAAFNYRMHADSILEPYDSISDVICNYYSSKNKITRIRQKSANLRSIANTALQRARRKYEIQEKQLKDTQKMDKFRIYGEMLNTYGYNYVEGEKNITVLNYYTNEDLTIPMDPTQSAQKNAQNYFKKYNKLKRTRDSVTELIKDTSVEIEELETILTSLDISENEADLAQIRAELASGGWVKNSGSDKKNRKNGKNIKAAPLKFESSEGFIIYVGKNNIQNEEVTFGIASGNDWWFHAKKMPGSHVIVKGDGRELPDSVFEEAARLAAFYSKGSDAPKVEIDYTKRRNLKKPNAANPGFVIYHQNFSMMAVPDITGIKRI